MNGAQSCSCHHSCRMFGFTRVLDRLAEFDLVQRKQDPLDRRSVLVPRTATGMMLLREFLRDATVQGGPSLDIEESPQLANPEMVRSAR